VKCGTIEEAGVAACRACGVPYADGSHAAYHAPGVHLGVKLGPTNCRRRDGHVSRNCAITLLDDHIAVSSGMPTSIAVGDIAGFRAEGSYNGEHYSGTQWLVLTLRGQEVGFMMKPEYAQAWIQALSGHTPVAR
jgi:hypothetical protein